MASASTIQPGSPAPDTTLVDPLGRAARLCDQWEAAPKALALVFLRHFG